AVVSGPGDGVALAASEGGAGHHERPLGRPPALHSLERSARILHSVDIVDFGMARITWSEVIAFDPMDIVERHGLGRRIEHRRLVHVVPEAGEAVGDE